MEVISASWRTSTQAQYGTYLNRWLEFCREKNENPYSTTVKCILNFIHDLHKQGLSYSTLNTARSALSAFITLETSDVNVGAHPLITRYMKGIFNLKPPIPRYKQVWDTRAVLNLLRQWGPLAKLNLKKLTLKLCILLALLGATRAQLLQAFRIDSLELTKNRATFRVDELMKTDRPGHVGHEITYRAYPVDRRLCVVTTLQRYLLVTNEIRYGNDQLFLAVNEPHLPVSKDTIARWIRQLLVQAGIDVNIFKAHSVRAASVSTAKNCFVPVQDIMSRAGWAQEKTFSTYYHKPIDNASEFERAILQG